MKRRELMQLLAGSVAAGATWPVWAEAAAARPAGFSDAPIRIVVPFPAGGAADGLARPMAQLLEEKLGQPVIVENRPGANTTIGIENVLNSPADGHSMVLANEAGVSLAPLVAPITKVQVRYQPEKQLAGVSVLAQYGSILTVNPSLPVHTLPEFIAYAKKNPGKLNYASFGLGSQPQMMMELLNRAAGIDTVHVPYKGVAPACLDLIAGRVQAMISAPSAPLPYIRENRLRAIAYSGDKRLALLPDVPTFAEGGLPDFEARGWFGLLMRAGTPEPVAQWLKQAIWSVVQSPEYQRKAILRSGFEVPSVDPAHMDAFLADDRAKWKGVVKDIHDRLV